MAPNTGRVRLSAAGGILVALAGLLAALAVVFSNASTSQQTADDAVAAQRAEAALGAVGAARTAVGQTLLVADTTSPQALEVLIDDSRLVTASITSRVAELGDAVGPPEAAALEDSARVVVQQSEAVVSAIESGDIATAEAAAADLAEEIDALASRLAELRNDRIGAISAADAEAGRVAIAARFMVALGIPGVTAVAWALLAGRRRRRVAMAAELARERELSKSKDQMIASISHELRTPLTGIYGAALMMEEAGFEDAELVAELNDVVIDQSAELKRMVEDLLVSAQADAGRLSFAIEAVSIEAEVSSVVAEFERTGMQVTVDCPPVTVAADPLRLRQMLRNLLSNAQSHGGPRIWIECEVTTSEAALAVADDGPGVDPDIAERLFTPFVHREDRPLITGSVGLGLSITRLLGEGMNGTVAHRRENGVTRFVVTLPRADAGAGNEGGQPADPREQRLGAGPAARR